MARKKQIEIERRRAAVAQGLIAHMTYRDMAEALGVSLGTIASDVKEVRKAWLEQATDHIESWIAAELAAIASDEAWLRQARSTERNVDRQLRIQDRISNLRERRAKLLGLDAPTYQRLLDSHSAPVGGERVVLSVGGSEEDYVAAMKAAQGVDGKHLRAVQ